MKYPNKIVKSVQNIFGGRNMFIIDSAICVKNMMSEFSLKDVKNILFFKYAKIKNSRINEAERLLKNIEHMVEYADTLYNNKDRYCYDFKGLAIKGNDLKALGIDDFKIK